MEHRRNDRAAWAAIALASTLFACGGPEPPSGSPAAETPRRGGTLVVGSISDVDGWNEYLATKSISGHLLRRIYLRLARGRGDSTEHPQTYEPQLAESWSFSEDGLELTFVLRDARWSDGQPVRAEDVRFTWLAQRAVPWRSASVKERITDVVVRDPRTVTFRFDRRSAWQLADAVEGGILPEHVFGQVPFDAWTTHDWSQVRVGSGPFVLERHDVNQEIVLARNPEHWDPGRPLVERVVVRVVPEIGNLLAQLRAGDVDHLGGIPPREADLLRAEGRVRLESFDYDYTYVGWNNARPPFDDPLVRRALTLAIDREALVDELLFGFGSVGKGPLLSDWWGADRGIEPWPYDPDEARRILGERGFAVAARPGAPTGPGRPLRIELLTNRGNRLREEVATKIQDQLARIGVELTWSAVDLGALIERASRGDYDGYIGGWTFPDKIDLAPLFASAAHPPGGANFVFYASPDIDSLLRELGEAPSAEAMVAPLHAIQRRLHEDQPYTFLFEAQRIDGFGPRLRGVEIENPADPLACLERAWLAE